jgi:hypothetical protein
MLILLEVSNREKMYSHIDHSAAVDYDTSGDGGICCQQGWLLQRD